MRTNWQLAVDSHAGIYAPQEFCEAFREYLSASEDIDVVLAGPDHEWYWEAWENIENTESLDIFGEKFTIHQDEDIWLVPENYDWNSHESL